MVVIGVNGVFFNECLLPFLRLFIFAKGSIRILPEEFVGKKVKVAGNPTRREGGTAMAAGVVTFEDGKVVCLGGCPGGPPVE